MAMILESIIKEPLKSNIAQRRSTIFNFYAIIIFLAFGADVYWIFWGPTAPGPYYLEVWIVISFFLFVAKQDALSVLSFAVGAVGLNVLLNTPLVGSPSLGENPVVYLCIASMFIAGTVLTTRAVDWIGGITIMSMIIAGTYLPPTHSQEWVENYWTITLLAVFMWRTSRASGISIETLFTQTQVQQEKIVEITKKKLAYINKISHELRSPLHTISGYSSRLLTGKETELENDLQVIKDTSTHASSIVDGVLDLARLESGQIEAVATRFNIIEMIETLVEIGECRTENNPPNYNFYTSSGFPAWIVADKVRTRQIISNLVNNAVKHSNCHNITIRLTHTSPWVSVSVQDDGIGIENCEKTDLFQPFVRHNKTSTKGAGLGLMIARELARLQKGDVTVTSDGIGKGATQTLHLPFMSDPDLPVYLNGNQLTSSPIQV